jgi:hypothetical protein
MREKLKLLYYNPRINIGRVRVRMDPAKLMAVSLKAMLAFLSDQVYVMPTEDEMRQMWVDEIMKQRRGGHEDVTEAEVVEEDPEPTVASLIGTSDNHNDT